MCIAAGNHEKTHETRLDTCCLWKYKRWWFHLFGTYVGGFSDFSQVSPSAFHSLSYPISLLSGFATSPCALSPNPKWLQSLRDKREGDHQQQMLWENHGGEAEAIPTQIKIKTNHHRSVAVFWLCPGTDDTSLQPSADMCTTRMTLGPPSLSGAGMHFSWW